jgi:hypothetical protein
MLGMGEGLVELQSLEKPFETAAMDHRRKRDGNSERISIGRRQAPGCMKSRALCLAIPVAHPQSNVLER